MQNALQIAMVSVECFPYVKVGGLGDVVPTLAFELSARGSQVDIVIPAFKSIDLSRWGFERLHWPAGRPGKRPGPDIVWRTRLPESPVEVFAVGGGGYFDRDGIYVDALTRSEYPDQLERWVFFQRAALAVLESVRTTVDLVHCHDHHTGFIPAYIDQDFRSGDCFRRTASVGTIHNLAYQGLFDRTLWPRTGLEGDLVAGHPCELHGQINMMKGLVLGADLLTTVSPTYAREIQTEEFGNGLDPFLRDRQEDLVGILNGIDTTVWNPETDPLIPAPYSAGRLEGKSIDRRKLLEELELDPELHDGPVLAMISRIDRQKGFDLLLPILDDLLSREVFFLLLGKGDREIERDLETIIGRHPDRARVRFGFDERLAHRAEAGADIFLMPSLFEPCGLNQMYSLKYGTVPIVRATGGLADTVEEFDPATGEGTGFRFTAPEPSQLRAAIDRALEVWKDPDLWNRLQRNGTSRDFSWSRSAERYAEVYRRAVEGRQMPANS